MDKINEDAFRLGRTAIVCPEKSALVGVALENLVSHEIVEGWVGYVYASYNLGKWYEQARAQVGAETVPPMTLVKRQYFPKSLSVKHMTVVWIVGSDGYSWRLFDCNSVRVPKKALDEALHDKWYTMIGRTEPFTG